MIPFPASNRRADKDQTEVVKMPTKHINDVLWRKVEKETVKVVTTLAIPVKDTKVLEWIISKGLESITEDDYRKFAKTDTTKK